MSNVTAHAPGSFCWPELATPDPAASTAFYSQLFGWTVRESPTPSGTYYMFLLGERVAAAMFGLSAEMLAQGAPPHWGTYVSVASADDAAARAVAAGGKVAMGPFDVMDAGRMAVLQDPLGTHIAAWQAKNTPGVGVLNEPGALGWTQLNARDPQAAKAFYPAVFGWTVQDMPMGDVAYSTWFKGDAPAGGMMPMPADVPAAAKSHWLPYFCVADLTAGHARAVALGATSLVPPSPIPGGGGFAVLADPQGALVGLMTAM